MTALSPNTCLITGASSGIGAAIARKLAGEQSRLLLVGRNEQRLEGVADICREAGSSVETFVLDLADLPAVEAFLAGLDPIAIGEAYLCAGLSDIRAFDATVEDNRSVRELGLVNFVSPLLITTTLARGMASLGQGRIALIGSHAAFAPLPVSPTYCGSKSGLSLYARALRRDLLPRGVTVTLVSPGFVETPMSARLDCRKPLMITADKAAEKTIAATRRGSGHLVLSRPLYLMTRLFSLMPDGLAARLSRLFPVRQSPRAGE